MASYTEPLEDVAMGTQGRVWVCLGEFKGAGHDFLYTHPSTSVMLD